MKLNYDDRRTHRDRLFRNPTWWKRRSALERGFIIALCGILLPVASARSFNKRDSNLTSCNGTYADNVCTTPACIDTASEILKNMDRFVNPCDDFYRFACGGFLNTTIIPDDKSKVETLTFMDDEVIEQLRTSIEDPRLAEMIHPFRLVRTLYESCMNKSAIEDQGVTPLLNILKKLGGWPVLEGDMWEDNDFSWMSSVYNFRKMGYSENHFLKIAVHEDYKNNTKIILKQKHPTFELSENYLLEGLGNKIVKEYYRYMVDIAVILGAERERAEQELMESLKFEMKLANMSQIIIYPNDAISYNSMTLVELSAKYSSIPWKEYFNTLLKPHTQVDDNEIINVQFPRYISEFEQLINSTPKRIQANYAMWRAVAESASYLNDEILERQLEYTTVLTGQTKRQPRWKECVNTVFKNLPYSVGALYARQFTNEDVKKNVTEMVYDIQTVDWMDEETRKSALDKLASMKLHIAYPDQLLQDSVLEEIHEKLQLDQNASYLENILNSKLFNTEYSFSELRKPVNNSDWLSHGQPAIVNAYYGPHKNCLNFPAGILQSSLFSNDRPKYMNYGAIGFLIGHEITHGFDNIGRQFDRDGNLVDWWAPSTDDKYKQKVNCIINQYGNYTAKEVGMNVDGKNTQNENVADNGGLKAAYLAYKDWADRNKPEQMLPGLSYSPKQMFWISTANTWCALDRPEELKRWITVDSHSPSKFRILGSLSNMKEFANDFNCPLNSRMNPQNKCTVW